MPRMSVNDAARRLVVSPDTILRRIKLNLLAGTKDNRGKWWVMLPDDTPAEPAESDAECGAVRRTDVNPRGPQFAEPKPEPAASHVDVLMGMVERMERQHQSAIQLLTERIDSAECRAEQAEQRLFEVMDRMSRPWWSRWLARP